MNQELIRLNNKIIYDINTTVLFTSEYNYTKDIIEFINHGYAVIDKRKNVEIDNIPDYLFQEFKCEYLKEKTEATIIDQVKLNILYSLDQNKEVYVLVNVLSYLDDFFKEYLLLYLRKNNKRIINYTSEIEESLLCEYLIVINNNKVIMEGKKEQILKEEKILKKLGFNLPFIIELSNSLQYYGIIDKTYYENESLVNDLWK